MVDEEVVLEGHQATCLDLLEHEIPRDASRIHSQEIRTELLE